MSKRTWITLVVLNLVALIAFSVWLANPNQHFGGSSRRQPDSDKSGRDPQ